jgi:tetratricopeptide (TPR) repeat protein
MAVHFPRKTAAWLALACLPVLLLLLFQSRNAASGSSGPPEGMPDQSGHASQTSVSQKTGERPDPKRNRSLTETFGPLEETIEKKLTATQIHAFVNARNRSVDALLSAFRLGGDEAYLQEAIERFPDHPQVLFASLSQAHDPAKRLAILENLKRVEPGNALGNCLAARALFDLGRKDEALAEMQKVAGKPVNDFTIASAQNDEEAYLSAGYPPAKAKMAALFGSTKRELLQLRGLGDSMGQLRESYQSAGDADSAQAVRDLQIGLARQLQEGGTIVDVLVGMVVEKQALKGLDSDEQRARLEEIAQRKEYLTGNTKRVTALMDDPSVAEGDWLLFFDRAKLFGETAANEWMLEKYPGK